MYTYWRRGTSVLNDITLSHTVIKQNLVIFKVHPTPKYFFHSNKYLHLFKTHCAFFPLFNPTLDFFQAVKVTKPGYHLLHDRASKGYGSFPGLTSQISFHACLQRLNTSTAVKRLSMREKFHSEDLQKSEKSFFCS